MFIMELKLINRNKAKEIEFVWYEMNNFISNKLMLLTFFVFVFTLNTFAQTPVSISMTKSSHDLQTIKAININDTALVLLQQGNGTNSSLFYTQITYLDSNKNVKWCRTLIDTLFSISPYDITYTNDSNLLIVGSSKENNTLNYKSFIAKITTGGDTLYTYVLNEPSLDISVYKFINTEFDIVKLYGTTQDTNGIGSGSLLSFNHKTKNILSSNKFSDPNNNHVIFRSGIWDHQDEKYYILGAKSNDTINPFYTTFILRLDTFFNVLNSITISELGLINSNHLSFESINSILYVYFNESNSSPNFSPVIAKLDTNLNVLDSKILNNNYLITSTFLSDSSNYLFLFGLTEQFILDSSLNLIDRDKIFSHPIYPLPKIIINSTTTFQNKVTRFGYIQYTPSLNYLSFLSEMNANGTGCTNIQGSAFSTNHTLTLGTIILINQPLSFFSEYDQYSYLNDSLILKNECTTVGIENPMSELDLLIYPIPCGQVINVKALNTNQLKYSKYEIYDLFSRKVSEGIFEEKINVNHLIPGCYLLKLYSNDNNFGSKIIIKS